MTRQQDDRATTRYPDRIGMIVTTNIPGKRGRASRRPAGTTLWASIDVEWTKNYRIKNGNRPFCYSVVYLAVPDTTAPVALDEFPFSYISVYVEDPDETGALLASANDAVHTAFRAADRITGHQFSSDLGVLANASPDPLPAVATARGTWLTDRAPEARDRVSVLYLRHSLSTALVALRVINRACWAGTLNVNRLLAIGLDGAFAWLDQPTFTDLL